MGYLWLNIFLAVALPSFELVFSMIMFDEKFISARSVRIPSFSFCAMKSCKKGKCNRKCGLYRNNILMFVVFADDKGISNAKLCQVILTCIVEVRESDHDNDDTMVALCT